MENLIKRFPKQLDEAMAIGRSTEIRKSEHEIRNILVCGMGGSGIGGNLVKELLAGELKIPMQVNKNYFIPAWVNKHSLLIISSYSGNTEESVMAAKEALKQGAHIVAVSSNGAIAQMAADNNFDLIKIPGSMPPRACLGYSFVQQFYIFFRLGLISKDFESYLKAAINLLDTEQEDIIQKAALLASKIAHTLPVIYCDARMESVAIRFRQQLNENAKMLCWHHVIPEMNHNELVGWRSENKELALIVLRNTDDYGNIQKRMEFTKEVAAKYAGHVIDIYSKGFNLFLQSLYLIHYIDWVSLFVSRERKVDETEVKVIDRLKQTLAKAK